MKNYVLLTTIEDDIKWLELKGRTFPILLIEKYICKSKAIL